MAGIINKILWKFNMSIRWNFPRPSIKFIKKISGREKLIGVEIGVFRGENSKSILETLNIEKLYLIDPYDSKDKYNKIYEAKAKNRLNSYKNKITWIKKMSSDAINNIPDDLDFVYIDGNHEYKYVKKDLEDYYQKLKVGGILAGHDINYSGHLANFNPREKVEGVIEAVVGFVNRNKLKIYINDCDWWVIKK